MTLRSLRRGFHRLRHISALAVLEVIEISVARRATHVLTGHGHERARQGGQIFQDGEWAAIPFLRAIPCTVPDSNLLDGFDLRAFTCPLTVHGFAIYKNGPPPVDRVPVYALFMGDGLVPIWFVRSELRAAIADDELTLAELATLPSSLIGSASFFEYAEPNRRVAPSGRRQREDRDRFARYVERWA